MPTCELSLCVYIPDRFVHALSQSLQQVSPYYPVLVYESYFSHPLQFVNVTSCVVTSVPSDGRQLDQRKFRLRLYYVLLRSVFETKQMYVGFTCVKYFYGSFPNFQLVSSSKWPHVLFHFRGFILATEKTPY